MGDVHSWRWSRCAGTVVDRAATYQDAGAFKENALKPCEFYDSHGLAEAEKKVLAVEKFYPNVVVARTSDKLYGSDGSLIAPWEHVYLLRNTDTD